MPDFTLNGFPHHWEEAGDGDEALVLVHGASTSGKQMLPHMAEFTSRFRVIVPDMRGMGQSAHVESIPASAWVDDLRALLDHLGLQRVHLYGFSLGSRVVMRFAADYPERVASLIVDAPIVYNEEDVQEAVHQRFDASSIPAERKKEMERWHGGAWATVVANYQHIRQQADVQEYLDMRERSKAITAPTLILRGDDRTGPYPLEHSTLLYRTIKDSWLAILPNTRSGVLVRSSKSAYTMMWTFLNNVTGATVTAA